MFVSEKLYFFFLSPIVLNRRKARANIVANYSERLKEEDILRVLDSLSDSNNHLLAYRHPIDALIIYLKKYFHPQNAEPNFSLAVCSIA